MIRVAALALLCLAVVGCRSPARVRAAHVSKAAAPAHPATVSALRFRRWISVDGFRSPWLGYWREALWFPEWQLHAELHSESGGPLRLQVRPEEFPRANTAAGPAWVPTGGDPRGPYQGPTERVEVPWDLAHRIHAAGELVRKLEAGRDQLGADLAATGLLREVKEGDTRQ